MYVHGIILRELGVLLQGNMYISFRPHKVVSEAISGHLKQFLNTVHRSVCCKYACVLQLG